MRFLNYMILGSLIFAFIEILTHFKPIFYLLTPEKVRIILVAGDIEVGILVCNRSNASNLLPIVLT